jgi:hypothetical protein
LRTYLMALVLSLVPGMVLSWCGTYGTASHSVHFKTIKASPIRLDFRPTASLSPLALMTAQSGCGMRIAALYFRVHSKIILGRSARLHFRLTALAMSLALGIAQSECGMSITALYLPTHWRATLTVSSRLHSHSTMLSSFLTLKMALCTVIYLTKLRRPSSRTNPTLSYPREPSSSSSWLHSRQVWDAREGALCYNLVNEHRGDANSVAFSPDQTRIAPSLWNHTIWISDTRSSTVLDGPFEDHIRAVNSAAFSPDGACIVSCSEDRAIRVWKMFSASDQQAPILSKWHINADGWVVDCDSRLLLFWLPVDLCKPLLRPPNTLIIRPEGSISISLNNSLMGESWLRCYDPPTLLLHPLNPKAS